MPWLALRQPFERGRESLLPRLVPPGLAYPHDIFLPLTWTEFREGLRGRFVLLQGRGQIGGHRQFLFRAIRIRPRAARDRGLIQPGGFPDESDEGVLIRQICQARDPAETPHRLVAYAMLAPGDLLHALMPKVEGTMRLERSHPAQNRTRVIEVRHAPLDCFGRVWASAMHELS